jgi:phage terminase large subunit-like protein
MAGRGFGKTRAGAEWVHGLAMSAPKRRIALVAGSIEEARSVMVDGASGLLSVAARHGVKLRWEAGELVWPNGSRAALHSGESPERLRGPNFHFAWADELAKWRCAEDTWANLQLGLRLGMRPRVLVTTTPRPRSLIEAIRADAGTVETGGKTSENVSLPPAFEEDRLEISRASFRAGEAPSVPLIEVREA